MSEQERSEETPTEGESLAEQPAAEAAPPPEAAPAEAKPAAEAPAKAERPPREIQPAGPDHAIVLPGGRQPGQPVVARRTVLQAGFWTGVGAVALGAGACGLDLIWPRGVTGFGGTVNAGEVGNFPPGTKTQVAEGKFWVVNLTEEQGGPGLLALWWKCPHLGCTVPWRPTFVWPDPLTGAPKPGWFRCPCHGSTYTDAGVRVFGPAPRSMDTMALTIEGGRIVVDTGSITPGGPDNASRAVRA
jgi:cytochrome b6-f complex iron-sulfur subunit